MGKHFLYLPVYFAAHKNFFGLLPDNVYVEIETCEAKTDEAAYKQLMDESAEFSDDVMAITDPAQILNTALNLRRKPAILATVVTNGGFWAVNHGSKKIKVLRDLGAFERVIAFREGTSSYGIAARIARESGITTPLNRFIEVVDPGEELLLLTDEQKSKNAFALSPDLLRIESMVTSKKASIELVLGGTTEYNDVLMTALLSHDEFVTANNDVVQAIVSGIQKALVMIRLQHPEVLQFAADAFRLRDHVPGAISKGVKAEVIPMNTVVAQAHWMHTAKAYFESRHPTTDWTEVEMATGLDYFKDCVEPYAGFAEKATKEVLDSMPVEARDASKWRRMLPYGIPIIAAISAAFLGLLPTLGILVGSWATWKLSQQKAVKGYPFVYWVFVLCAVAGILLAMLPYAPVLAIADKSDPRNVGLGMLFAALSAAGVGYGIEYSKRDSR